MNPRPIEAKAIDKTTLLIKFSNNEVKKIDISHLLIYSAYSKLQDYNFFKQVKADGMTVYWDDEIDIDPDYLYENSILYKDII